jgi:hypothetical protein
MLAEILFLTCVVFVEASFDVAESIVAGGEEEVYGRN